MFKKNLYITKGINESVSDELKSILWLKVQEDTKRKLDYLQVFELINCGPKDKPLLKVIWSQEVPAHKETFFIKGITSKISKIWIICEGEDTEDEYSTMLLPEEY